MYYVTSNDPNTLYQQRWSGPTPHHVVNQLHNRFFSVADHLNHCSIMSAKTVVGTKGFFAEVMIRSVSCGEKGLASTNSTQAKSVNWVNLCFEGMLFSCHDDTVAHS